jgi:hypothetical protein
MKFYNEKTDSFEAVVNGCHVQSKTLSRLGEVVKFLEKHLLVENPNKDNIELENKEIRCTN